MPLPLPLPLLLLQALVLALMIVAMSVVAVPMASCGRPDKVTETLASHDMPPVAGLHSVAVPAAVLVPFVAGGVGNWSLWNAAVSKSSGTIGECNSVDVAFRLHHHIPLTLPSSCLIYALNGTATSSAVSYAWEYSGPGLFGVHISSFSPDPDDPAGSTLATNWERAMGSTIRLDPSWWKNQFAFVASQTFNGLDCLASVYAATGTLLIDHVVSACRP